MPQKGKWNPTSMIEEIILAHVEEGDICLDATCGRGNDTKTLCEAVGESGKVYGMDIQQCAVESTRELLERNHFADRAEIVQMSHADMDRLGIEEGTLSCITFNFGWLPKGDHSIMTQKETSILAIEKGLKLLRPGGIMTLIIYYGKDTGYEEKEELMKYLPTIDNSVYTVIMMPFVNRPNDPPIPVVIVRNDKKTE